MPLNTCYAAFGLAFFHAPMAALEFTGGVLAAPGTFGTSLYFAADGPSWLAGTFDAATEGGASSSLGVPTLDFVGAAWENALGPEYGFFGRQLAPLAFGAAGDLIAPLAAESVEAENVTLLRGTNRYAEQYVYEKSGGYIMSDAARSVYLETNDLSRAYAASEAQWNRLVSELGSPDAVIQAHSSLGTEFESAYGPRPLISWTTNQATAEHFSGGGAIFETTVPSSEAFEQTLPGATESEQLLLHMTRAIKR
jgi:hypothetical protein